MNKEEALKLQEEVLEKYKKICILMPTYKNIPSVCAHDFFVLTSLLYQFGFEPQFRFIDQTNVVVARNFLQKQVVKELAEDPDKFDIVLWLDSDQRFTFKDVLELISHYHLYDEIDILSGRYITRDLECPRVCAFMVNEDKYVAVGPDTKGIKEVDGVGFGFVLMTPKVMQDMQEEYGNFSFEFRSVGDKETGGCIGEDLDWCDKAKKIGYKIYLDSNVEIGHYGGLITEKMIDHLKTK